MNEILSVIMPVYNAERYLAAAVESVLRQDLTEFELICINDGSTDRSASILKSYSDHDSRIRIIDRKRQGLVASLNDGLQNAVAPIIARMDADDVCLPGRFAKQFAYLSENPDVWVVGMGRKLIDGEGREFHIPTLVQGAGAVAAELERSCAVCHPTIMMRRQPILDFGGYREAFAHAEDYDLWLRVVEKAKIDNLPIHGILHRIHSESVSEKHKIQQRVSAALAQACHRARIQGSPDPSIAMTGPPDLWSDKILDALIPERIDFFRSILILFNPAAPYELKISAFRAIEKASPQVKKQNKKLQQEALIFAASRHRGIDLFKLRSLATAARIHPTRFFKSAFAARGQIDASTSA